MKTYTRFKLFGLVVVIIFLLTACSGGGDSAPPFQPLTSAEVAKLQVPNASIKAATLVSAGAQKFVQSTGYPTPQSVTLPFDIIRVQGTAMPTSDSSINFELWIPATGWNQKLWAFGNGGYSGSMGLSGMVAQLTRGYATLIGDTGHDTEDMMFVVGNPEKMADWGYRSVHAITVASKYILTAAQGTSPKYSYYSGCSTGGGQGLAEAQRYPEDFDGILAGDPGNNRLRLNIGFLNMFIANHDPGVNNPPIIPLKSGDADPAKNNKLPMIQAKVIEKCDALDGVTDGILDDPRLCTSPAFDATRDLLCPGADAANCLTAAQVTALTNLHTGALDKRPTVNNVTNPNYNKPIYQWPRGVETSMRGYMGESGEPARTDFWKYWVFDNPDWDWWSFDFNRDFDYAILKVSENVDNMDQNLKPFKDRKGKMIIYNGWADGVVSATDTALYYDKVVTTVGGTGATALADTQSFVRLFLVPGMAHCSGGFCPTGQPAPASAQNDWIRALENWVENGIAPDMIIGATVVSGAVDMTRPICAYPKIAKYKGSAPYDKTNAAVKSSANWSCENP
jgi:feruloyl esterase